jgi:hypothetical protein
MRSIPSNFQGLFLRFIPRQLFHQRKQAWGQLLVSRVLAAIFGALSLHPEIPFPAAGIEPEVRPQLPPAIPTFGAP